MERQVYRIWWQPKRKSVGDQFLNKELNVNEGQTNRCQTKSRNFLPHGCSWDDSLWCNVPNHLCLLSSKIINRLRENRKYIFDIKAGNGIIVHMGKNQLQENHMAKTTGSNKRWMQRRQEANKDDRKQTKMTKMKNNRPCFYLEGHTHVNQPRSSAQRRPKLRQKTSTSGRSNNTNLQAKSRSKTKIMNINQSKRPIILLE